MQLKSKIKELMMMISRNGVVFVFISPI